MKMLKYLYNGMIFENCIYNEIVDIIKFNIS
jgi:hypothetical protein